MDTQDELEGTKMDTQNDEQRWTHAGWMNKDDTQDEGTKMDTQDEGTKMGTQDKRNKDGHTE